MQPKQSPWRTCSDLLCPVSTWPKLKSTPWWRKTATLASSSPQCTWTWPEGQVNRLEEENKMKKWCIQTQKVAKLWWDKHNFNEELWSYFGKQDGAPGWRPESTWGCERTLTDRKHRGLRQPLTNTHAVYTQTDQCQAAWQESRENEWCCHTTKLPLMLLSSIIVI